MSQTSAGRFLASPTWRIRMWMILAMVGVVIMETTEISLWYQALFEPAAVSFAVIFAILLLIFTASQLISREMEALHWRMSLRQLIFAGWVILAIFGSLKLLTYPFTPISIGTLATLPLRYIIKSDVGAVNFYHPLILLLLIWRGVSLARGPVMLKAVQNSFQFGLIVLLLYGMIYAPLYPGEANVGLYTFLFCGLLAMSAARVSNISDLRGGRIPRFGVGWTSSILLAGLVVVGLAILAGWLISGYAAGLISTLLVIIFSVLTAVVLFLFSPLLILMAGLIPRLADIIEQMWARLRAMLPVTAQLEKFLQDLNNSLGKIVPYVMALRGLAMLGLLVVILLAILLALYIRKLHRSDAVEEEAETAIAQPGVTENPLRKLLNRLFGDLRGARLGSPAQLLAAARIRQIYRLLMLLSIKMGVERPPSVTPLEFLPKLKTAFQEEDAELGLITNAYLKVRYGEYPETRQELEAVETAWKSVHRKGRQVIASPLSKKATL